MKTTPLETLFKVLDDSATIIANEKELSYLEALAATGDNISNGEIMQDHLSEMAQKKLQKMYDKIMAVPYAKEDIRKAFQLACLKGMRNNVQPNHQMTPDSIGMLLSFLIGKFMEKKERFTLRSSYWEIWFLRS